MDTFLTSFAQEKHIVGLSVSVVRKDNVIYQKSVGFSDLVKKIPVSPKSQFRVGSITKLFSAVALMQLMETNQEISLNTTVMEMLQKYAPTKIEKLSKRKKKEFSEIQLWNLVTHTAGFEDSLLRLFTPNNTFRSLEEIVFDEYCTPQKVFPTGEQSSYSNYGITVLGYLLEIASGMSFEKLIEEKIFKPLGMNDSVAKNDPNHPLLGKSYRYTESGFEEVPFTYIEQTPAGVIQTTTEDMNKFMIALLNREKLLLHHATWEKMFTPIFKKSNLAGGVAVVFFNFENFGYDFYGHDGSLPSFTTRMVLIPELQMGLFIGINTEGNIFSQMGEIFVHFVQNVLPKKPETLENIPIPVDPAIYEGEYVFTRRNLNTYEKFLSLLSHVQVERKDGYHLTIYFGPMLQMIFEEPSMVVKHVGNHTFQSLDGKVGFTFFKELSTGKFQYIVTFNMVTFERIPLYESLSLQSLFWATVLLSFVIFILVYCTMKVCYWIKGKPATWNLSPYLIMSLLGLIYIIGIFVAAGGEGFPFVIPTAMQYVSYLSVVVLATAGYMQLLVFWEGFRVLRIWFAIVSLGLIVLMHMWNLSFPIKNCN